VYTAPVAPEADAFGGGFETVAPTPAPVAPSVPTATTSAPVDPNRPLRRAR